MACIPCQTLEKRVTSRQIYRSESTDPLQVASNVDRLHTIERKIEYVESSGPCYVLEEGMVGIILQLVNVLIFKPTFGEI